MDVLNFSLMLPDDKCLINIPINIEYVSLDPVGALAITRITLGI